MGTHASHFRLVVVSCDCSAGTAASLSSAGVGGETRLRMGMEAMIGDDAYSLIEWLRARSSLVPGWPGRRFARDPSMGIIEKASSCSIALLRARTSPA